MLVDTAAWVPDDFLQFEVCIVGSGPAGITLARGISRAGLWVCLLESGGHKPTEEAQNLNAGAVDAADGYLERTLRDAVGSLVAPPISGITRCAVNTAGTFATCRWMKSTSSAATGLPESGWPFGRREIQHFYERAQQVSGIGQFDYRSGLGNLGQKTASLANGKDRVGPLSVWLFEDFFGASPRTGP
jgi:choline dehydrogenase-like flavoprotein